MHSQWKTKIVGGKLVTVPIHPQSAPAKQDQAEIWITKASSANNRIEAHRNKQRALQQLHTSVLSPQDYYLTNVSSSHQSNLFLAQNIYDSNQAKNEIAGLRNTQKSPSIHSSLSAVLPPGLRSELQFELRLLTYSNHSNINYLHNILRTMDKSQTRHLYSEEILEELESLNSGLNLAIFFETMQYCNLQSDGLVNYEIFMRMLSELQPTILPPVDLNSSQRTLPNNMKMFCKLPDSLSHKNVLSSQQLEDIGALKIPLNQFETNVHYRNPAQKSEPSAMAFPKSSQTYSLESNSPCDSSKKCKQKKKLSSSSTFYDRSNRKHWIKDDKMLKKLECAGNRCWWKDSPSDEPNTKTRKDWTKSERIKTMKGKKRRELIFIQINNNEKKTYTKEKSHSDSECQYTSDINSGLYTTTDVEITTSSLSNKKSNAVNTKTEKSKVKITSENKTSSEQILVSNVSEPLPITSSFDVLSVREEKAVVLEVKEEVEEKKTFNIPIIPNAIIKTHSNVAINSDENTKDKICHSEVSQVIENTSVSKSHPEAPLNQNKKDSVNIILEPIKVEIKGTSYSLYPSLKLQSSDANLIQQSKKRKRLTLEWIYGFSGIDIHITPLNKLLFAVRSIVVLMDPEKLTQVYYRNHTHKVTCLCVEKNLVASAQDTKTEGIHKGVIYIWDSVKLTTDFKIHTQSTVSAISFLKPEKFSHSSSSLISYIATVQENKENHNKQIHVYNIKTAETVYKMELKGSGSVLIASSPTNSSFVIYGSGALIVFFTKVAGECCWSMNVGDFNGFATGRSLTAAAYTNDEDFLIGDSLGNIYESEASSRLKDKFIVTCFIKDAHAGPISSLISTKQDHFITGSCKDLEIKLWDKNKNQVCLLKMVESCVGCLAFSLLENLLYVVTSGNSIISLFVNFPPNEVKSIKKIILSEGHADEIVSICPHASYSEICFTLSSDGFVNMYNADNKSLIWSYLLKGNGSYLTLHPCKDLLFVGCLNGSIHVLDSSFGSFIEKFKNESSSVTCLQFAKDGSYLASGHMNGNIILYHYDLYENYVVHRVTVSENAIVSIDWCTTKSLLRVQTCSLSMIYYNISENSLTNTFHSIDWETNNCSISYETSGLWSTKSNTAKKMCASQNHFVIAFSTDQLLCLATYPYLSCEKGVAQAKSLYGCGQVKQIMLSFDCSRLFLCFDDGCLWQWRITTSDLVV